MYDDGTFAFYSNSNKHGTMPASTAGRDDDGDDDDNENVILLCSLLLLQPLSFEMGPIPIQELVLGLLSCTAIKVHLLAWYCLHMIGRGLSAISMCLSLIIFFLLLCSFVHLVSIRTRVLLSMIRCSITL